MNFRHFILALCAALTPAWALSADPEGDVPAPRAKEALAMSARPSHARQAFERSLALSGAQAQRLDTGRVPTRWQFESTEGYEIGDAIAMSDRWVAVGGRYLTALVPCQWGVSCGNDARLRVFDSLTGQSKWTADFDLNGTFDSYLAVAIEGDVVLATGYSINQFRTNNRPVWVVNAYSAQSGTLLWRETLADPQTDFFPQAMTVRGGRAYVTGVAGAECYYGAWCEQLTRAYDVSTGQVLWSVLTGVAGVDYETLSVAADDEHVYIAGNAGPNSEVRSLDARNGSLRWLDQIPDNSPSPGFVFKVVADDHRVAIGAVVNGDWLLRVYQAETGRVLWTSTWALTGADQTIYDAPVVLDMRDGVLVAGGYGSHLPFGSEPYPKASRDWAVRAYAVADGRLLWSDVRGSPTDTDEANGGVVIAQGKAVVLGFGAFDDVTGNTHTLVRAYELLTGALAWEQLEPRYGFAFGVSTTLAGANGRVAAVSYVQGSRPAGLPPPDSYGVDMLLRTYDLRGGRR